MNRVYKSKVFRFACFQFAFIFSFCAAIAQATQELTRSDYAGLACVSLSVVLIFRAIELKNWI